ENVSRKDAKAPRLQRNSRVFLCESWRFCVFARESCFVFLAFLLVLVFSFFSPALQKRLRTLFRSTRALVWTVPVLLTAIFALASSSVNAFSVALTGAVLLYCCAPTLCVFLGRSDFLAIAFLWFPIEFAAGAALVPRPAQGFLHSVAYGVAILLGLTLFLCFRGLPGMKYNLPRSGRDFWLPLAGFALLAPVLVAIGIPIGFIPAPHLPPPSAGRMASTLGIIFAGTAIPEEILFRSLIQNMLMQRFGANNRILILASFIFGCAHLDNGPQPVPNWRYMILATVAGFG